jgi:hypothetical protein
MNALFTHDEVAGTVVRAFINVNAGDLKFTQGPDGRHKCTFDLVAFTFGDNGVPVDERSKTITLSLNEAEYRRFLERGLVSSFVLPVKKSGGYQVRLAIRDTASDRLGSANQFIEIPDVKKGKLLLSGMVLESLPMDRWRAVRTKSVAEMSDASDPQRDTSVGAFKAGTVLRFGYQIYNARLAGKGIPGLAYRLTLYSQNKPVYETPITPIQRLTAESSRVFSTAGALQLGEGLAPGDYTLRVDVFDGAPSDGRVATQFVQFEIVE